MSIICLDAGHGGNDPGASANNLIEAVLTGRLCKMVAEALSGYDVEVKPVPRGTLAERVKFANDSSADYYCSIHCNAGGGTGFESFVYNGAGEKTRNIAWQVHNTTMGFLSRYGVVNRGVKQENFAVLRETKMPAILLECLFLDNRKDAELLKNDTFFSGLANEIAFGLAKALNLPGKQDHNTELFRLKYRVQFLEQRLKHVHGLLATALFLDE